MNIFKMWTSFYTTKNFVNFFHIAIIASFLFIIGLSGCGYKTPPVWVEKNTTTKAN